MRLYSYEKDLPSIEAKVLGVLLANYHIIRGSLQILKSLEGQIILEKI
jgi:hypothetical protein